MKPRETIWPTRKKSSRPSSGHRAGTLTPFRGGYATPLARPRESSPPPRHPSLGFGGSVRSQSKARGGFIPHTPQQRLPDYARKAQERWLADVKRDPERAKDVRRRLNALKRTPTASERLGIVRPDISRSVDRAERNVKKRRDAASERRTERYLYGNINRPDIEARVRLGHFDTAQRSSRDIQRLMAIGKDRSLPLSKRRSALSTLSGRYDVPMAGEKIQELRRKQIEAMGGRTEGSSYGTFNLGFVHLPTGAVASEIGKELAGTGILSKIGANSAKGYAMLGAATGLDKTGVGKFALHAAQDAVNLPAQVAPSIYLPGRALFKAANFGGLAGGSDTSELKDLWQSYKDTGVLPSLASGHIGTALSHFMEHPVYGALELRGAKAAVGRGAGVAMRAGGKLPTLDAQALGEAPKGKRGSGRDVTAYMERMEKAAEEAHRQGIHQKPQGFRERMYAAAHTGRKDLQYYGKQKETGRRYSKDVTGKAFQKLYERHEAKRGIDPFQAREGAAALLTRRHIKDTERLFNAQVAALEAMRREGRGAGLKEVQRVLGEAKPMGKDAPDHLELAPWIVKRIVRSPTTWKEDLAHEIERLTKVRNEKKNGKTGFDRRVGEGKKGKSLYAESKKLLKAHKQTVETLQRLHDTLTQEDVQQAFQVANDFDEWSRRTRGQLIDRGVLLPHQAEFAPLMPYAVSHMGAKWTGGKREGHLSVDGKTELTADAIRAHMQEHAPEVSDVPTPATHDKPHPTQKGTPPEIAVPPGDVVSPVFTALKHETKAEAETPAVVADRHNPSTEPDNPRQGYLHPEKHAEQIGKLAPGESIHVNERVSIRRKGTPNLHLDVLPAKPIPKEGLTLREAAVYPREVLNKDTKEWRDDLAAGQRDLAAARERGDIQHAQQIDAVLKEHIAEGEHPWEVHPDDRAIAEEAIEQSRKGKASGEARRRSRDRKDRVAAAAKVEPKQAKVGDEILWHGEWKPIKSIEGGKAYVDRGKGKAAEVKLTKDVQVRRIPDEAPVKETRPVYEILDGDKVVKTAYKTNTAAKHAVDYAEKNPPEGLKTAPEPIKVEPSGHVNPAGTEPLRAAETPPASPQSRSMLSEEMKRYTDPGFISEGEHFGKGAFYIPLRRNRTRAKLVRGKRTGEAFRLGYAPTDPEAMLQEIVRTRGVMDSVDGFDQLIRDFGVRAPNGKFWRTTKEAEHWLEDTPEGEALAARVPDSLVPVRVADVATARENLKKIKERALPEALAGAESDAFFKERLAGSKSTGSGSVILMPNHLVNLLDAHLSPTTSTVGKAAQRAVQEFKGTVLPFSPRWFYGNVLDTIGLRAIASYGLINPYEYRLGYKLARKLAVDNPKAARQLRSLGLGGTHVGSTEDLMKRRTSEEFDDGQGKKFLKKTEAFFQHPGPREFGQLFRATQRSLFAVNRWFESQPQYAMLGRHARHLVSDQSGSYMKSIHLSEHAMQDVLKGLKNTDRQEAFAREVQEAFGRWHALTPNEKSVLITTLVPFYSWMRNSAKFVFLTLPRDHPIKAGMVAMATDMSEEERKAMGLDWFVKDGRQPVWRQGLLPVGWPEGQPGDGGVRVQNYTSFGPYADPAAFFSNQMLPWASGLIDTMGGLNWKNQPIKNPDGSDLDPLQRGALAFYLQAEAMIPLLRMARQAEEGGATAYDTSTLFTPHTKPDQSKSAKKFLRAWGDPFKQVKSGTTSSASSGWGGGGGGSSGGWGGGGSGGGW